MECFKNHGFEEEGRSRWVDAGFRPAYGGQASADKSAKRIGG
jgi:hypothetical protein